MTGIRFSETSGVAEITFDDSNAGTTAFANTSISGHTINSANVMVTTGWLNRFGTSLNSYSFETYIHEIGHALGLGHGGNYNGSATYGIDNFYLNNSLAYSIMSYMQAANDEFSGPNTFVNASFRFMLTPQIADIIAIQHLYGDTANHHAGNTTYGFGSNTGTTALDVAVNFGASLAFTVFDEGGNDTFNFEGTSANQVLNLGPESFSSVLGGRLNVAIARGVTIENAIGGSGNDTIAGNSIGNTLRGRGGNDTIDGGLGDDSAVFSGVLAAYRLIALGGTGVRVVGPDGTDTVTNVERLVFDDQTVIWEPTTAGSTAGNDFNGDGRSDILWRHAGGAVAEWQMDGSQIAANLSVAWPGNEWHFQDTGDFGGDGMSDVMWRHDTGQVVLWRMDGSQIVSNTSILNVSNQYHVQGLADFGGDGRSDVLFRHDSGQVVLWQMNGDQIATNTAIATVSRAFHIEGVGDFGGDGRSDVLWRNDNGQVIMWQMNGDQIVSNTAFANVSQQYQVQGIGDFNGDGRSDVLWRHDSGQIVLWQMNGDQIISNTQILNVSNQYHVEDVRDYNGDGMSDVLLRHDVGQVVLWQMNGDQIAANVSLGTVTNDWSIQHHHFDVV